MELTFKEIVEAINGRVILESEEKGFNKLSIDTRKIEEGNIYLALKGENFNGNNYVEEAFNKGAKIAIIDEVNYNSENIKGNVILVENTDVALMKLANFYREKLGIKVVGITGSTGKTSTKDLVAAFLSQKYKVFKTKGNFNNQIGLPLMILELDSSYDVAVLEMGMSGLGEIDDLARTARPDIAIITNIGLSHIEHLKTQDNIFKAKMEISNYFKDENVLVLNGEDKYLSKVENKCYKVKKIGNNDEYDVFATNIILEKEITSFTVNLRGKTEEFTLNMPGAHNVLNAMLGICVADELGVTLKDMKSGLENLEATSMRLQLIKNKGLLIINDCYNASPDSMKSSLNVLSNYDNKRKVAILGTMGELGHKAEEAHYEVGEYATDKTDLLIVIGEYTDSFEKGYKGENILKYKDKEKFLEDISKVIEKNDVVLVKASRSQKFEEIVESLKESIL